MARSVKKHDYLYSLYSSLLYNITLTLVVHGSSYFQNTAHRYSCMLVLCWHIRDALYFTLWGLWWATCPLKDICLIPRKHNCSKWGQEFVYLERHSKWDMCNSQSHKMRLPCSGRHSSSSSSATCREIPECCHERLVASNVIRWLLQHLRNNARVISRWFASLQKFWVGMSEARPSRVFGASCCLFVLSY